LILEDVPPDELQAALEDQDFSEDESDSVCSENFCNDDDSDKEEIDFIEDDGDCENSDDEYVVLSDTESDIENEQS
jgi:hypothetical protein